MNGETRSSAPHELQHTGDQVYLRTQREPTVAERERGPMREPSQPVLTDMGPPSSNGGGPDAADDTEEELHRLSVYETDPPRERKAMHNNRCIEPI